MDTGMNPTKSTDKNRNLHGGDTGWIRIALDQRPAGHRRFPQPPGPPPNQPLPDPPTPWAKTTPEYAQGRTSQAQTIQKDSQGLVGKILATEFDQEEGDFKILMNLYKSRGKRGIDKNTGRPYKEAVEALSKALKSNNLSEEEERAVFKHLQWRFFCQKCKEDKPACEFDSCSRKFWATKPGGWVFLHGEMCTPCEEEVDSFLR